MTAPERIIRVVGGGGRDKSSPGSTGKKEWDGSEWELQILLEQRVGGKEWGELMLSTHRNQRWGVPRLGFF